MTLDSVSFAAGMVFGAVMVYAAIRHAFKGWWDE